MVALAAIGAALWCVVEVASQDRGGRVVYEAPPEGNQGLVGEVELYARSHAVVIGIDRYEHMGKLKGAVKDARAVSEVLKSHGMEVTLLLDGAATRRAIADLLGTKLKAKIGAQDRVMIYFAGHGTTVGEGPSALGYLMPIDGDPSSPTSTGISMSELQAWLGTYPSKHTFFVADACYSGLAVPPATTRSSSSRGVPDYLRKVTSQKVRLTLVAGGSDEEVLDNYQGHGLFTWFFIKALEGDGDLNGDGLITSDELAAFIKPAVAQTALGEFKRPQNPHMGRAGEGEFVFLAPKHRQKAAAVESCPSGMEFKAGQGCVPIIGKAVCPSGMEFKAGQGCIPIIASKGCPTGMEFKEGRGCVAKAGQDARASDKASDRAAEKEEGIAARDRGSDQGGASQKDPPGEKAFEGMVRLPETRPATRRQEERVDGSCPSGMEFKAGQGCVPIIASKGCPTGMEFKEGRGCVAKAGQDARASDKAVEKEEGIAARNRSMDQEGLGQKDPPGEKAFEGMVKIPAGEFWMGSDDVESDEQPRRQVNLDAYWIDKVEVTVEGYGQCVREGKCSAPKSTKEDGAYNWEASGRGKHPINGVDWAQAVAYCEWAGKRLPSEAQWEKAARGTDGRTYPWGEEEASCERAVMDEGGNGCGTGGTMEVGSKKGGASPYGVEDMAGNVWEWVQDWYDTDYYASAPSKNPVNLESGFERILRGGSWGNDPSTPRAANRGYDAPSSADSFTGFRCARFD